jgi:hypothetical protein
MSERQDQMFDLIFQAIYQLVEVSTRQSADAMQLRARMRQMKILAHMARIDATRKMIEKEIDAAMDAWIIAMASYVIEVVSAIDSEEGMVVLQAKLDILPGILSEISVDVQSIKSRVRDLLS